MIILSKIPFTPCYIVDELKLRKNLEVLKAIQDRTGCRIVLALKGFAMFSVFGIVKEYLHGVASSSLHEARLGFEEFGKEVHTYAPAYQEHEFQKILKYSDRISFNSISQWEKFKPLIDNSDKKIKCALRVNPEHSEVKVRMYDPCAPGSRLGIKDDEMKDKDLEGISGLHFHTLCELNSDSLERTVKAVEDKFGFLLEQVSWVNFGGGHHITREDYDIDLLCKVIRDFKRKYDVDVYLEPGEAIALNTGVLVAKVLDIVHNEMDIAILDTSAAAHMPDVLEMPYRPVIDDAGDPGKYAYTYRLGGLTCLAGDVIGDYSFKRELKAGDVLVFNDMAHYTMVKNNTFNGVNLPGIVLYNPEKDDLKVIREFGYEDYKNRLS